MIQLNLKASAYLQYYRIVLLFVSLCSLTLVPSLWIVALALLLIGISLSQSKNHCQQISCQAQQWQVIIDGKLYQDLNLRSCSVITHYFCALVFDDHGKTRKCLIMRDSLSYQDYRHLCSLSQLFLRQAR